MKAGAVIVLLGLTALVSYSVGRQGTPDDRAATHAPAAASQVVLSKPVAFAPVAPAPSSTPTTRTETDRLVSQTPTSLTPPAKPQSDRQPAPTQAKLTPQDKPTASDTNRKIETALTAAAIAAILIKASREQYYATGHPCACPDDLMRNGRACGARSAHSRPGGASPLCYPADVTAEMIEAYRRQAARANQ
ncbi:hypothetical protein ACQR1Y_11730 [Bradyrhizobium sp. HKCCYLRH3099]|uniref:hypothetical protein n=1 Tax=unclassified Bradyrhizobium TaxID=2631580 RepID=UPI003EBE295C